MQGNFSIRAPTATAIVPIAPINKVNPAIAATPISANGATRDIVTKIPAIRDMNDPSNIALLIAFLTLLIIAKTPTKANIGIAIAVKANTPNNAWAANVPISVNGSNISEHAPAKTDNAKALSIALSIPLATASTATNAINGSTIAVNAKIPLTAEPIFILPAILRATDMASINADKPSAASIPSRKLPKLIFFKALPNPSNTLTSKLTKASIKAGICSDKLFITPIRSSQRESVIKGAFSAKESRTPSINFRKLSAN